MTDDRPSRADILSEPDASRLLARASELDATYRTLAELRAAAAGAGISDRAFDAALAEMRAERAPTMIEPTPTPRRPRRLMAIVGGALLVLMLAVGVSRMVGPALSIEAPLLREAYLLRCLSPGEAAELIRPVLTLGSNQVKASPANAPRALTVYGTREQLAQVRSLLDDLDALGSVACTRAPTPTPAP